MKNWIPITRNFDKKPIGWMKLLPDVKIDEFSRFEIGYIPKKVEDGVIVDAELIEVSLVNRIQK